MDEKYYIHISSGYRATEAELRSEYGDAEFDKALSAGKIKEDKYYVHQSSGHKATESELRKDYGDAEFDKALSAGKILTLGEPVKKKKFLTLLHQINSIQKPYLLEQIGMKIKSLMQRVL